MYGNKSKRVPLLNFLALFDIFLKEKIQKFQVFSQKNVLRFLSRKYSADFGRYRLVYICTLITDFNKTDFRI